MRILLAAPILWTASLAPATGQNIAGSCLCDPARPETLEARSCSLTREAMKQPPGTEIFFLKDASPRKPNRWLALPAKVRAGKMHTLADLTPDERTRLWTAAIAKAKELWGDDWGVAYNADHVRTQCHLHLHIGKLFKGLEEGKFVVVDHPSQIPVPRGDGLWVHGFGKRLKVHVNEQITETVLLR